MFADSLFVGRLVFLHPIIEGYPCSFGDVSQSTPEEVAARGVRQPGCIRAAGLPELKEANTGEEVVSQFELLAPERRGLFNQTETLPVRTVPCSKHLFMLS
jgi:hypothetical protein